MRKEKMNITEKMRLEEARKKNGHKHSCKCVICNNMNNKAARNGYEEEMKRKMDKSLKPNGHKSNCVCPICRNMKNKSSKTKKNNFFKKHNKTLKGGKKKKGYGHKTNCKCPICKN